MNFTLNDGVTMPVLGFGVFQTPPEQTVSGVRAALDVGYRHIDTAAAYGNERQVGQALTGSDVDRADVFVETKVWISDYLETLLADGRVRAIGVSNSMPARLDALLAERTVVPAVNQIEVHPSFRQTELLDVDTRHGILSQAWSPIGGITYYRDGTHGSTLRDPTIGAIAEAHNRTPAQVIALAPAAGSASDPQVGDAVPDSGEHRRVRLRAGHRRAGRDHRARHRRARWSGARAGQTDFDRIGPLPVGCRSAETAPDRRAQQAEAGGGKGNLGHAWRR